MLLSYLKNQTHSYVLIICLKNENLCTDFFFGVRIGTDILDEIARFVRNLGSEEMVTFLQSIIIISSKISDNIIILKFFRKNSQHWLTLEELLLVHSIKFRSINYFISFYSKYFQLCFQPLQRIRIIERFIKITWMNHKKRKKIILHTRQSTK